MYVMPNLEWQKFSQKRDRDRELPPRLALVKLVNRSPATAHFYADVLNLLIVILLKDAVILCTHCNNLPWYFKLDAIMLCTYKYSCWYKFRLELCRVELFTRASCIEPRVQMADDHACVAIFSLLVQSLDSRGN